MSWLPQDYKEPSTSNYMQFDMGDNTFRILGEPIMGVEYWKTLDGKRKPVRVKPGVPVQIEELENDPNTGEMEIPKFFWAFPVYNFIIDKIQILEIKQKTIRQSMQSYITNPKWGEPIGYNFTVTKTKEGGKTSYTVAVDPKEELDKSIIDKYKAMNINLEALFLGDDPFAGKKMEASTGEIDKDIADIFDAKA